MHQICYCEPNDQTIFVPEQGSRPRTSSELIRSVAKVRTTHRDHVQILRPKNAAYKYKIGHRALLKFTHPIHLGILLDSSMRQSWFEISACLFGNFYLLRPSHHAGDPKKFSPNTDEDVICHRRDVFHVAGSVRLPLGKCHIRTGEGDRIPIIANKVNLSAIEDEVGEPVKSILSLHQIQLPGLPPHLTVVSDPQIWNKSNGMVEYHFVWKQLGFSRANTQNNMQRKFQKTFRVRVQVVATLSTGAEVPVSEILSSPIIVCGGNPITESQNIAR